MSCRWIAAAACCAAAFLTLAGPAAADPINVLIYVDGNPAAPQQLDDVHDETYHVRGDVGQTTLGVDDGSDDARLIRDLLGLSVSAVDVIGPESGTAYALTTPQALGPNYENAVAGVYSFPPQTRSIRPLTDPDTDINAGTVVLGSAAHPLLLFAHTNGYAPISHFAAIATSATTVRVTGDSSCGAITYAWGDGSSSQETTHTYTDNQTSHVVVANSNCDGRGGAAITTANLGTGGAPTPGPGTTATPTAGPSATASPRPTRTPSSRATATPTVGAKHGGGSSRGTATATPAATATAAPAATAVPTPSTVPTPAPTPTSSPSPSGTVSPRPRTKATPTATPAESLPVVKGRLISAVVPVSAAALAAASPPAVAAAAGGAPDQPAPSLALPLGLLAIVGLALAGAWRERRGL